MMSSTRTYGIRLVVLFIVLFIGALIQACDSSPSAMDSVAGLCGNAIVEEGEICDDGVNDGTPGGCLADCSDRVPVCDGQPFVWQADVNNPVIALGQGINNMLWNDPSVRAEGNVYRMWLSGGDPTSSPTSVRIYHATSDDGSTWSISPSPVLEPGPPASAWDGLRVETPSLVRVGDTYHLYYSGCQGQCDSTGSYAIGHATSPDGIAWTKDPANPIISQQSTDPHEWGYNGAGEPGILYDESTETFYLYYVSMRFDEADPTLGHVGILLATSTDGSNFTHHVDAFGKRVVILTRDVPGAASGSWFGTSTPSGFVTSGGEFHLFYDFLIAPFSPANTQQIALAHARSIDGITFEVVSQDMFPAGTGNWHDQNIRAPTAVFEGTTVHLWFAGDRQNPFGSGVGRATLTCP